MKTEIKTCTCNSEYQDKKYGKGKRVHNETTKGKGVSGVIYRCTVCGSEK